MYSLLPRKNRDDEEKESKQVLKTNEVSKTEDVSKTDVSKTEDVSKKGDVEEKKSETQNLLLSKISEMSDIPKDRTWRDYVFFNFFWGW